MKKDPSAPVAKQIAKYLTLHNHERKDNYAWLKDKNWQEVIKQPKKLKKEIREYLDAENQYTEHILEDTTQLQTDLFKELRARIKEDDSSVPEKDGDYYYYVRYEENKQYPIFCRYKAVTSELEEVLLDANVLAEEYSYFDIGDARHSPNHEYFAYSADTKGSEFYTLFILDLKNKKLLTDKIINIQSDFVWAEDNQTIFYTTLDKNHRPDKVYRHTLGEKTKNDCMVYQETDPGFFVSLDITESRRFILISAHDHVTSEIYTIDALHPKKKPILFAKREPSIEYEVTHQNDIFLIVTNKDDCEDYKIMQTSLQNTEKEYWTDYYVPPEGTLLRGIYVFKHYLIRSERVNGLPRIVVIELKESDSNNEHEIAFEEEAYELNVIPGYEYDSQEVRFSYTSMTTPTETYDYHMSTRVRVLRKRQEIPSGHTANDYKTRRIFAKSEDNEKIPITLLYKKSTAIDGSAPLLLYAYGSYGTSMPASFSSNRLSLVNRGFIYAIAHVRGGMEKGYAWYRNGKLNKKENTFNDYITCAEYLIKQNYTSENKLAVHGGSAGGMLVGAVINMRPKLFMAAIADVPFVDVLNTMCDTDLPLTPAEWPEWGNPIKSEDDYLTIQAYSPYENIHEQNYPHILVTAGLTDPRVTYWEPAKWVAKLRAHKTDNNILVLKTNMDAGHAGASGRFDYLKEVALIYVFLLKVFDMTT